MKIFAIGRNYAKHAKELNNNVPDEPVFFLKPETALLTKNRPFYYPEFTNNLHYEAEIVIRICKVGKHIPLEYANRYYDKIGIGVDFTARDLQQQLKEKGLPWEKAKAFDHAAPISEFIDASEFSNIQNINFSLLKNGKQVQLGNTSNMLFKVDEIIAYLSKYITFKIGDLIFTGTPEGVGPVSVGDVLDAYIEDKHMLKVPVM